MKLLVVRHGETQFNAEHRYLGALDPELNARGRSQARELQSVLPDNLAAVVSSPLRRARQTADIFCQERVAEGLAGLYASYASKVVALVAHGFVAKVARTISQEGFRDFFEWQLANGAVCELTMTPHPSIEGMPKRLRLFGILHVKRQPQ